VVAKPLGSGIIGTMMKIEQANQIVSEYQIQNDINLWVDAFVELSFSDTKTAEQAEAVETIQSQFDKLKG
jgi:hypothetical protein